MECPCPLINYRGSVQKWGMDTPFRKHMNIVAVFSRENLDADIQEVSLERH